MNQFVVLVARTILRNVIMILFVKSPRTTATNVCHLILCTAYFVMVPTLSLIEDAKLSKKFTLELLRNSIDKVTSRVALMKGQFAGFSLHSSFFLDRYINDKSNNPVAVSESHGQKLGFNYYDVCRP